MGRPKLPEGKHKVSKIITTDPDVMEASEIDGNSSDWFNRAGRLMMEREQAEAESVKKKQRKTR